VFTPNVANIQGKKWDAIDYRKSWAPSPATELTMQSHWVDNEAAHKAFMRRGRVEGFVMIALATLAPVATMALVAWRLLHPSC
jgi:hypothetical protein